MRDRLVIISLVALMFCGMCIIENSAVRSKPVEQATNNSSIYMLAGEFRSVFANLLWMKVENYHHEYIKHNADWAQNKELVGLLDLIITLDPRFVEAYADAAYIYADGYKNKEKAMGYIKQGISNNPKSRELYELAAIMYVRRYNDPVRAIQYAKSAAKYAEDDWYRMHTKKLLKSVERIAREKKGQQ